MYIYIIYIAPLPPSGTYLFFRFCVLLGIHVHHLGCKECCTRILPASRCHLHSIASAASWLCQYLCVCVCVYIYICIAVRLCVCLSVCLFIDQHTCLPISLSTHPSIHPSIHLFIRVSYDLAIYLSVRLAISSSDPVYACVYLCMYIYIDTRSTFTYTYTSTHTHTHRSLSVSRFLKRDFCWTSKPVFLLVAVVAVVATTLGYECPYTQTNSKP